MADGRDYGYFWNDDGSGDRTYNADSFEYWLKKFFTTGVFAGDLQVTAGGSYTVNVATGYANVNGKVKDFYNTKTFTVPSANSTYPRVDTIVVRRDDTNKIISLQYVTGTYSGKNPSATAPTRSGAIYELVLAEIYVGAGATEILQRDITDKRTDKTVCGIVTGTVEEVDFSQFASQFKSYFTEFKEGNEEDFDAWFQKMKDQLSTDAAGHLQLEIDGHTSQIQTLTTDISNLSTSVSTKANQSLLAPIQSTLVASKAYVIGEQFVYQGLLYTVTTAIAQGGTITINGNCALSDDVTSQIKMIKDTVGKISEKNDAKSGVANNMWVEIARLSNLSVGTYVLTGFLVFQSTSSTGSRMARFASIYYTGKEVEIYPNPNGYTQIAISDIVTITQAQGFIIQAKQNSNATMNISGQIKAIRVG